MNFIKEQQEKAIGDYLDRVQFLMFKEPNVSDARNLLNKIVSDTIKATAKKSNQILFGRLDYDEIVDDIRLFNNELIEEK